MANENLLCPDATVYELIEFWAEYYDVYQFVSFRFWLKFGRFCHQELGKWDDRRHLVLFNSRLSLFCLIFRRAQSFFYPLDTRTCSWLHLFRFWVFYLPSWCFFCAYHLNSSHCLLNLVHLRQIWYKCRTIWLSLGREQLQLYESQLPLFRSIRSLSWQLRASIRLLIKICRIKALEGSLSSNVDTASTLSPFWSCLKAW